MIFMECKNQHCWCEGGVGYLTPPIFMPIPTGSEAPAAESPDSGAAATTPADQPTGSHLLEECQLHWLCLL